MLPSRHCSTHRRAATPRTCDEEPKRTVRRQSGMRVRWVVILVVALVACSTGSSAANGAGACVSFTAEDVRRWFDWDIVGELTTGAPNTCRLELASGSSMTIVISSAAMVTDHLIAVTPLG